MRIVTWNCRGGFHRKAAALAALNADIAVIQECALPHKWREALPSHRVLWHGADSPIGVAVIVPEAYALELAAPLTNELRTFLPVHVGGPMPCTLIASWTKQGLRGQRSYIGQLWHALDLYAPVFADSACLVLGDLNSNAIWDRGKPWQHLAVNQQLNTLGMTSVYHHYFAEGHGQESLPTYRHNTGAPFHLDYCYAPNNWLTHLRAVAVGGDEWLALSDHRPVIVDFDFEEAASG